MSIPTIKRLEAEDGELGGRADTGAKIVAALEAAGVEFTNGGQPGVRMRSITERSEMVKTFGVGGAFRIGDHVRYREGVPSAGRFAGVVGTVVDGHPQSRTQVPVRFENEAAPSLIEVGHLEIVPPTP